MSLILKNVKKDYLISSFKGYNMSLSASNVKEIFIHDYAGGINLTAQNGAKSMHDRVVANPDNGNTHYCIDSNGNCYQVIPETTPSYNCGNYDHNIKSISLEITNSLTGGNFNNDNEKTIYKNAWLNACKLVSDLCIKYNLSTSAIKFHQEVSSTSCPYTMVKYFGSLDKARSETKKQVQYYIDQQSNKSTYQVYACTNQYGITLFCCSQAFDSSGKLIGNNLDVSISKQSNKSLECKDGSILYYPKQIKDYKVLTTMKETWFYLDVNLTKPYIYNGKHVSAKKGTDLILRHYSDIKK